MPIHQWPSTERPREKLLHRGAAALSDAELLALFLGSGLPGQDAVSSARALLAEHGSLRRLLALPPKALAKSRGIGPARACLLAAAREMAERSLATGLARGEALTAPQQVANYLNLRLRDRSREVFAVMFLDHRLCLLAFEELFHGTLDHADVYPREILHRVLAHNAAAVILAHNHPSGDPEPSHADRQLTRHVKEALGLIDVRLVDHFIIGGDGALSMAERGLL